MTPNEKLLAAIKSRSGKATPFRYGILTADKYVANIQDVIGTDRCYKHMCKGTTSFTDVMQKAAKTLVYANEDMDDENGLELFDKSKLPSGLTLPKNTLMVFKHVLTSSRKDRDGDILHSDGASVDPKMLLLWQHVHTMPIGKLLVVADQNEKKLHVISAIVDMNDLCHDSAVMVDNGMGRFSHGFRAFNFSENKEGVGGEDGFDVKTFEIMEESLVSVPANPDAEVEEVLLSLVEGGKLTSCIMKEVGRGIRSHRNIQVQGTDIRCRQRSGDNELEIVCNNPDQLKQILETVGDNHEKSRTTSKGTGGTAAEGGASTSTQTDVGANQGKEGASTINKEIVPTSEELDKMSICDLNGCKCYGRSLVGSYQWISEQLGSKLADHLRSNSISISTEQTYCYVYALFDSYAVAEVDSYGETPTCSYYRISWKMEGDEPIWDGTPKETRIVEVEVPKSFVPSGSKPYPNEHAARQVSPDKYDKFRRQNDKFGDGIHAIWGITKDGTVELQSIRFDSSKFTADEAKKWLKDNDFSSSEFEEAKEEGKAIEADTNKGASTGNDKSGRTISGTNEQKLKSAKEHIDDVRGDTNLDRTHEAKLTRASGHLDDVLKSVQAVTANDNTFNTPDTGGIQSAMSHFIAYASADDRKKMIECLNVIEAMEKSCQLVDDYRSFLQDEKKGDDDDVDEPSQFEGDLYAETHKEDELMDVKDVAAYLTNDIGLKVMKPVGNSVEVECSGKEVAARLIKKGWQHKYFTEEDDKRCDALHIKCSGTKKEPEIHYLMKATSIYSVKCNKGEESKDVSVITLSKCKI